MTTPNDWPRELVEMTAAAICNEDAKTTTWDKIRPATADRYRELAVAALSVARPEIERIVREQVAAEIEAAHGSDPRFPGGWASTKDRDRAADIARGAPMTEPTLCAHCGKPAAGYASVHGKRVCHTDAPGRPDCYRLVTVYGEQLGRQRDLAACIDRGETR